MGTKKEAMYTARAEEGVGGGPMACNYIDDGQRREKLKRFNAPIYLVSGS